MFSNAPASPDARLQRYDHVIVHVTATRPSQDWGAAEVDRLHRSIGWRGCGYHALIRRNGDWEDSDGGFPARPIGHSGAHVGDCGRGWNGRSFAISMAGGVREDNPNRPENNLMAVQLETLREGIGRFLALHPNPGSVKIMGHRDLIRQNNAPPKACPCFDVIPWWANSAPEEGEEDAARAKTALSLEESWTVAPGETLSRIAHAAGVPMARILQMNPDITDPNAISVGQVIRLA